MSTKTGAGLATYAKAQLGRPYWWGTYGQVASQALLNAKRQQYPDSYRGSQYASQFGRKVHDCVGLIKGYLWCDSPNGVPQYNASQDVAVAGLWNNCTRKGDLATIPEIPGVCVFNASLGHVGVYIGNGEVVEAMGQDYGVVKTKLHARNWTRWGMPRWIDYTVKTEAAEGKEPAEKTGDAWIWSYLMTAIGNPYGVAAIMGNLYAESALSPKNLQNSYEKSLGYTDDSYTAAVDNGSYGNFVHDSAGYGLAQWTFWSRKQGLLDYAKSKGKSIGDLQMQLDYMLKELSESYAGVLSAIKGTTSVRGASDTIVVHYESPADQSNAAKARRAAYGQAFYDTYAGKETAVAADPAPQDGAPAWTLLKTDLPLLKRGMSGIPVKNAQRLLIAHGYNCGGKKDANGNEEPDGDFGEKTEDAIRDVQTRNSLHVDGELGSETWPVLIMK